MRAQEVVEEGIGAEGAAADVAAAVEEAEEAVTEVVEAVGGVGEDTNIPNIFDPRHGVLNVPNIFGNIEITNEYSHNFVTGDKEPLWYIHNLRGIHFNNSVVTLSIP